MTDEVKTTHTVFTDALGTLGKIIDETAQRDAIHLAVEPVVAAERVFPGQDVGKVDDGYGSSTNPVGIVDPFLKRPVNPGQRFWLVVYPRQITSLRHVWEHPAFDAPAASSVANDKSASERWMRAWAVRNLGNDYYGDDKMRSEDAAYADAIEAGHALFIGPYESARDNIDNEWWDHWEAITGVPGQRNEYFSCSC